MDPAGVFATRYQRDQALVRTDRQRLALAAFLVFLVCVPWLLGPRMVASSLLDMLVAPRATRLPSASTMSMTSSTAKSPTRSVTPGDNNDVPRDSIAATAPASMTTRPTGCAAKAIHSRRADN